VDPQFGSRWRTATSLGRFVSTLCPSPTPRVSQPTATGRVRYGADQQPTVATAAASLVPQVSAGTTTALHAGPTRVIRRSAVRVKPMTDDTIGWTCAVTQLGVTPSGLPDDAVPAAA